MKNFITDGFSLTSLAFNPKEFEPLVDEYKMVGGINSEIRYLELPDGAVHVQARYGAKKGGFSYDEAVLMAGQLKTYQELLETNSVSLPSIENISVEHDLFSDRAIVIKTSAWTGYDLASLLKREVVARDDTLVRKMVHEMCQLLVPLCKNRYSGWEVEVGVDARSSNFTLDKDGKIWFIDLFPPRYRVKGVPMVEWPAPKTESGRQLGLFKHFDVRGIALCAIAQLSRVKPKLRTLFEEEVARTLSKAMSATERSQFLAAFANLPWKQVRAQLLKREPFHQEAFLSLLHMRVFDLDYGVYLYREIALEFAMLGFISEEELEAFFAMSHFEDLLSDTQIHKIESSLLDMLHRVNAAYEHSK